MLVRRRVATSPRSSFCNNSTARLRWGIPSTSARNSSDSTEMSGLSSPAAAKMSITPSEATARETIWRNRQVQVLFRLSFTCRPLGQGRPHRLEETHIVADAESFRVRHC